MTRFRWYHLYRLGHSMRVNRNITVPLFDSGAKGWLFKCECGRTWAV
jgi:hypothetical protein